MSDHTTTVYVADSDSSRRSTVSAAVEAADGLELVGSGDVATASAAIDEAVPTVVLLGSGNDGALELVESLHHDLPAVAIAVVDPADDFELLAAGVLSTLPSTTVDVAADVDRMLVDEPILPSDWAAELQMRLDGLDDQVRRSVHISETEREVMTRSGNGDSVADIAADNDVSPRLVRQHLGFAVAKYQLALEAEATLADHAAQNG